MIFVENDPEPKVSERSIEEISLEHAQNALGIKIPEQKPRERIPFLPEGRDLNLNKINKEEVTIGDLQKLHDKKSVTIEQERFEEQKKVKERQRILKESRENDRQRIELERRQETLEKENDRQKRQEIIEQRKQEVHELREKESKDINSFLGGSELLNPENNKEDSDTIKEFDDELF